LEASGLISVDLESGNRQYVNEGIERAGFALDGEHWLTLAPEIVSRPRGTLCTYS